MNILGISAFTNNSAACLLEDGKVTAAVQEERFSRQKNDSSFPAQSIQYCLDYAAISLDDIDAVAFFEKPGLKFDRLLKTHLSMAPHGLKSFISSIPGWLKEKVFAERNLYRELKKCGEFEEKNLPLLFPEHHLSHAASTFFTSDFEEAAILTVDGEGEWATSSISFGSQADIKMLRELTFPHSVGLLYTAFTWYLGFKKHYEEDKLLALARLGNPESQIFENYVGKIKSELIDIREDGSVWLNQDYFNYSGEPEVVKEERWELLFGFPKRDREAALQSYEADLALAIQVVIEEIVLNMAKEARELTGSENLCLTGEMALNGRLNKVIREKGIFKSVFTQPASGDAGGAIGAALAAYHIYFGEDRVYREPDGLSGCLLGPHFLDYEILHSLKKYNAAYTRLEDEELYQITAELIADGNIVGWFQGRMEFGNQTLGNRSVLADPRDSGMRKKIHDCLKYEDNFQHFGLAVTAEQATFFIQEEHSLYGLTDFSVRNNIRRELPDNYEEYSIRNKADIDYSEISPATRPDFTTSALIINKETNRPMWKLLNAFNEVAGLGLLLQTSMNREHEPPACTPEDAYRCLMTTGMDYLVIENYVFAKEHQPKWEGGISNGK